MLGIRMASVVTAVGMVFSVVLSPLSALAANAGLQVNEEQSVGVHGDFQVGPTRFALSLDPGEEQTVTVQVLNRYGTRAAFRIATEDFSAGDDALEPTRLYGTADGPFPARAWVQPAATRFELNHGERAFVTVRVRVPRNAEAGDHYAALLVEREPESSPPGVNVVARVGALFLLTVKGPVVRQGAVTDIASRKWVYWTYPASLRLTAINDGTVHMVPQGTIVIRNIFGLPVREIPVDRWIVLRGSARSTDLQWYPRFALGRYTATTNLRVFDTDIQPLTTSFWVIPALPVLLVLIVIFLISFLVQVFFARFEIRRKH